MEDDPVRDVLDNRCASDACAGDDEKRAYGYINRRPFVKSCLFLSANQKTAQTQQQECSGFGDRRYG